MKKFALAIAALAIAAAPMGAFAHDEEVNIADTLYVLASDDGSASVWQETNGDSGLQTEARTHEDGSSTPADTKIAP